MTPQKISPPIRAFASAQVWEAWLAKHHSQPEGIWMKIYKKNSRIPTVTYPEALELALCYGWIDGQVKSFDDKAYLLRFTPRRRDSIWSKINRDKALQLIRAGRMQPAGHDAIAAAKKNGRWSGAYASPRTAQVPDDFASALKENPAASSFFGTLTGQNRYAFLFQIETCKNPETRRRKILSFVDLLTRKKTLPTGKSSPAP